MPPVPGKDLMKVYEADLKRIDKSIANLQQDQRYLSKMDEINRSLNSRRSEAIAAMSRHASSQIKEGYMSNEKDGDQNLARRNLGSVYGRVK